MAIIYKELNTVENKRDYLLMRRKEILLDQFNRKKSSMETLIKKKSQCLIETRNTIKSNENENNVHKHFLMRLKDINVSIESTNYGTFSLLYTIHFYQLGADE